MDKQELRGKIESKLETALVEFSKGLSEKKFKKHIKKAGKILSEGLSLPELKVEKVNGKKAAAPKGEKVAKKAPVKKAKKSAAPIKKNAKTSEPAAK